MLHPRTTIPGTILGIIPRLVLCLGLILPSAARAANPADDQTVLYYLVEVQRQYKKTCNGVPADGSASSLLPSESLRTLAGLLASSAQPAQSLLEAHGLGEGAVFHATVTGDSPQEVFSRLLARDCAALMVPSRRYIGASSAGGAWTLLMADREPVFGAFSPEGANPSGAAVPAASQDGVIPLEDPQILPADPDPANSREQPPSADPSRPPEDAASGAEPPAAPVSGPEPPAAPVSGPEPPADPLPPPLSGEPAAEPPSQPATRPVRIAGSSPGEDVLALINEVRARGRRCGEDFLPPVPPLVLNPVLTAVAREQIEDMIRGGYFASTRPDGKTLGARLSEAGYSWDDAAESIASVSPPAARAVTAWLNQESQCRVLLSPAYTEAGAAFDGRRNYWVFTLTRPLPEGSDASRLKSVRVK
ncbi:MAG: CAP domain-containing protein [Desulfovibrio sp.]|jgi:uncharacterized protein YkwD|nr:CAP domain-containing protein [Desulfovibrio sp.]